MLRPEGLTLSAIVLKEGVIELNEAVIISERPTFETQLNKDIYHWGRRLL